MKVRMLRCTKKILFLALSYLSIPMLIAMDPNTQMLVELERIYKTMADNDVVSVDTITKLYTHTSQVETALPSMNTGDRERVLNQAQLIQNKYKAVLRRVLKNQVTAAHAINKKKVYAVMSAVVYATLINATMPLVHQGLQIGTDNLQELDQNALLSAALEGGLAELVRQGVGSYCTRIGNIMIEVNRGQLVSIAAGATAALTNASVSVAPPTKMGLLMAALKTEAMYVCTHTLEQEGGFLGLMKKINVPRLMIGAPVADADQRLVVSYIQPQVRTILSYPKIQRALMQTMAIACDSVMVGIIMHSYLNLGFADERGIYNTIEGAAIRGLMEGFVAYLINRRGGAPLTIGSGMLSRSVQNMLLKGSGLALSMTDVTTTVLHKGLQTAVYYTIDQSGGLGNLTKTLISKTAHAIQQYWWRPFKQTVNDALYTVVDYAIEHPLF